MSVTPFRRQVAGGDQDVDAAARTFAVGRGVAEIASAPGFTLFARVPGAQVSRFTAAFGEAVVFGGVSHRPQADVARAAGAGTEAEADCEGFFSGAAGSFVAFVLRPGAGARVLSGWATGQRCY